MMINSKNTSGYNYDMDNLYRIKLFCIIGAFLLFISLSLLSTNNAQGLFSVNDIRNYILSALINISMGNISLIGYYLLPILVAIQFAIVSHQIFKGIYKYEMKYWRRRDFGVNILIPLLLLLVPLLILLSLFT